MAIKAHSYPFAGATSHSRVAFDRSKCKSNLDSFDVCHLNSYRCARGWNLHARGALALQIVAFDRSPAATPSQWYRQSVFAWSYRQAWSRTKDLDSSLSLEANIWSLHQLWGQSRTSQNSMDCTVCRSSKREGLSCKQTVSTARFGCPSLCLGHL